MVSRSNRHHNFRAGLALQKGKIMDKVNKQGDAPSIEGLSNQFCRISGHWMVKPILIEFGEFLVRSCRISSAQEPKDAGVIDLITLRNDGKNHVVVELNGKEIIREFYVSGEIVMNHSYHARAYQSLSAGQEWQPIETARKDGQMILVCLPRMMNLIIRARYDKIHNHWLTDYEGEGGVSRPMFFHPGDLWQDMPASPATKSKPSGRR